LTQVVEQFKATLGVDVEPGTQKAFDDMEGSLDDLISGFGKLAAAAAAAVAGLVAATTVTNAHTAVQTNLANALGISAERLETWGFLLGAIGLDAQSVTKTMRVLNDRIGELAQGADAPKTLTRAVKNLKLESKALQDLAPEQQFEAILQAAQDAEDGQLAMASATELLGREGVKLVGWVRTQTMSVAELLEMQAKLNLQTEEGRAGAVRMTAAMDNLGAATESMWALFSGLVGEALAPVVEAFNMWVAANRELIQQKIKQWAESFGRFMQWLVPRIRTVISMVTRMWQRFNQFIEGTIGWERFVKILGAALGLLTAILAAAAFLKFIETLKKINAAFGLLKLKILGPILVLGILLLIIEDVWTFLEGGESLTGKFIDALGEYLGLDLAGPIRDAWPAIKDFFASAIEGLQFFAEKNFEIFFTIADFFIQTFGDMARFFIDIFRDGIGPAFDRFVDRLELRWHTFVESFKGIFTDMINFVLDKLGDLAKPIRDVIGKVGGFLGVDVSGITNPISTAQQTAAGNGRTNNTNRNNAKVEVGGITIVQKAGESARNVAQNVRNVVGKMAADALRSNSTGVEY
jgi:hypothetical protein